MCIYFRHCVRYVASFVLTLPSGGVLGDGGEVPQAGGLQALGLERAPDGRVLGLPLWAWDAELLCVCVGMRNCIEMHAPSHHFPYQKQMDTQTSRHQIGVHPTLYTQLPYKIQVEHNG